MHIHLSRLVWTAFMLTLALSARAGIGVAVNGTDISAGSGAGWTFVTSALSLTNAGPFVISGSNGTNRVSILAAADCAVVTSNLTVDVSSFSNCCAFAVASNVTASLLLAGTNRFARRLVPAIVLASAFGVCSTLAGFGLAVATDLPVNPTIIAVSGLLFALVGGGASLIRHRPCCGA